MRCWIKNGLSLDFCMFFLYAEVVVIVVMLCILICLSGVLGSSWLLSVHLLCVSLGHLFGVVVVSFLVLFGLAAVVVSISAVGVVVSMGSAAVVVVYVVFVEGFMVPVVFLLLLLLLLNCLLALSSESILACIGLFHMSSFIFTNANVASSGASVYFPKSKNPKFFSNGLFVSSPSICVSLLSRVSTLLWIMIVEGSFSMCIVSSLCLYPISVNIV